MVHTKFLLEEVDKCLSLSCLVVAVSKWVWYCVQVSLVLFISSCESHGKCAEGLWSKSVLLAIVSSCLITTAGTGEQPSWNRDESLFWCCSVQLETTVCCVNGDGELRCVSSAACNDVETGAFCSWAELHQTDVTLGKTAEEALFSCLITEDDLIFPFSFDKLQSKSWQFSNEFKSALGKLAKGWLAELETFNKG